MPPTILALDEGGFESKASTRSESLGRCALDSCSRVSCRASVLCFGITIGTDDANHPVSTAGEYAKSSEFSLDCCELQTSPFFA